MLDRGNYLHCQSILVETSSTEGGGIQRSLLSGRESAESFLRELEIVSQKIHLYLAFLSREVNDEVPVYILREGRCQREQEGR
jgi:hypothetical protein